MQSGFGGAFLSVSVHYNNGIKQILTHKIHRYDISVRYYKQGELIKILVTTGAGG